MNSLFSKITIRAHEVDSILCVGLDPHLDDLPEVSAGAAYDFCMKLIEATETLVVAYKPNIAFFEALGADGISVLIRIIQEIPNQIPVILDAKRGDISSTAKAYAQAAFDVFGADAVTVNAYLGREAIEPFIGNPSKGVFILCKTSNPGAAEIQDIKVRKWVNGSGVGGYKTVYEKVAELAASWNQNDNIGLVVGATQPDSIARVRRVAPELWILAPGVGAQGGDLCESLHAGLLDDGLGLIVPVSRGISRADNPRKTAQELRNTINRMRSVYHQERPILQDDKFSLADNLLDAGCIKFGQFTLKSGIQSPVYIDLRQLIAYPDLLEKVAAAYLPILQSLKFDHLGALPYAAIPIATAISLLGGWSMVYPRKESKVYGTKATVEGQYILGERAVLIDDLITTGGSKFEGIDKLSSVGLKVRDIVVLIDRQSGASNALKDAGYRLHSVFEFTDMLDHWENSGRISTQKIAEVRDFLESFD
jgi:uridine monophosphate synthetase